MGDRREAKGIGNGKSSEGDPLAFLDFAVSVDTQGRHRWAVNSQNGEVVGVVARSDRRLADLRLTIGVLAQDGECRAFGFGVVDDMGVGGDLVAIADDKSCAAKAELGAVGLVVGADDDNRRLDFLDGGRQIGHRCGRQQKQAKNKKTRCEAVGRRHIVLFDATMRDHSGDGVVMRGSKGWSSRMNISRMRLT